MKKQWTPKKILWLIVASIFFVMGTLGTMLPILPTVPCYLVAAFGFAQSSDRLHAWFEKSELYKKHVGPYLEAGGLPVKGKASIIAIVTVQVGIPAFIFRDNMMVLLIISAIYIAFLICMLFVVKTIPAQQKAAKCCSEA
ncbi:MAG: YbaN family protein [Peptococcaceae bacterium]|nr:YbaN family protein [Peptococcaceae bacterium]